MVAKNSNTASNLNKAFNKALSSYNGETGNKERFETTNGRERETSSAAQRQAVDSC